MAGEMAANKSRPFTVFVEGNIGSGKNTFLNYFANADVHLLSEPVEMWRNVQGHNLLGLMYDNPSRWALAFQTYAQLTLVDHHTRASPHPVKMMERSIYSARYCFVENLAKEGLMPASEYVVLDEWFKWITSHCDTGGDLIVYLRTDPEVVFERIRLRAWKEESHVTLQYLKTLHELHEDWLINHTKFSCPAPVIVLDANRDLNEMEEEFRRCKTRILSQQQRGEQEDSAAPPVTFVGSHSM